MKSEIESFPLPTKPEGVISSLVERFNSGDASALMELHEPHSVFVENNGQLLTDRAAIAARLERDVKLGLPLAATVRHVFIAEDIAQIVVDWSIDGMDPHGNQVHLAGSACDIVRRGADGFWRYIIDNNQGTAVRQPA
ncbi:YybH family protein [Puia sp. P3]|uniref:YybH family protein n=1 Tax=Puia sp. P3 TaxID=3423952 RepID=UPI003D67C0F4